MSSEKTQYYSLHRWRPEDAFLRAEFNENSELVDSALHGIRQEAATGVSGVQAAVEEARRAAEEAVEGARSEALAAVSGAKTELTEALNKAKADLNAAVAAAKKEAAAAVEEAKSEAEQAVQDARDAVPLVRLGSFTLSKAAAEWRIDLSGLDLSPYSILRLYARLRCSANTAYLRVNGLTSGYSYAVAGQNDGGQREYLLPLSCPRNAGQQGVVELTLYLQQLPALFARVTSAYSTESSTTAQTLVYGCARQISALHTLSIVDLGEESPAVAAGSRMDLWGLR